MIKQDTATPGRLVRTRLAENKARDRGGSAGSSPGSAPTLSSGQSYPGLSQHQVLVFYTPLWSSDSGTEILMDLYEMTGAYSQPQRR